jgi:hypothetical protein
LFADLALGAANIQVKARPIRERGGRVVYDVLGAVVIFSPRPHEAVAPEPVDVEDFF